MTETPTGGREGEGGGGRLFTVDFNETSTDCEGVERHEYEHDTTRTLRVEGCEWGATRNTHSRAKSGGATINTIRRKRYCTKQETADGRLQVQTAEPLSIERSVRFNVVATRRSLLNPPDAPAATSRRPDPNGQSNHICELVVPRYYPPIMSGPHIVRIVVDALVGRIGVLLGHNFPQAGANLAYHLSETWYGNKRQGLPWRLLFPDYLHSKQQQTRILYIILSWFCYLIFFVCRFPFHFWRYACGLIDVEAPAAHCFMTKKSLSK